MKKISNKLFGRVLLIVFGLLLLVQIVPMVISLNR